MKKLMSVMLALSLVLALSACNRSEQQPQETTAQTTAQTTTTTQAPPKVGVELLSGVFNYEYRDGDSSRIEFVRKNGNPDPVLYSYDDASSPGELLVYEASDDYITIYYEPEVYNASVMEGTILQLDNGDVAILNSHADIVYRKSGEVVDETQQTILPADVQGMAGSYSNGSDGTEFYIDIRVDDKGVYIDVISTSGDMVVSNGKMEIVDSRNLFYRENAFAVNWKERGTISVRGSHTISVDGEFWDSNLLQAG